jgi:hypothetical protein
MERFAGLLDGVRSAAVGGAAVSGAAVSGAVGPAPVLVFTSGSNPSPWWLRHADFVWRGGLDDDAPADHEGGRHDRFATYIDTCLDALRTTGLPVSSIVTFSVVENQHVAYRSEDAGLPAWERHCWFLAGRGTHHHDLYVAPDSLSRAEWDVLAEVLASARWPAAAWSEAGPRRASRTGSCPPRPSKARPSSASATPAPSRWGCGSTWTA